METIKELLKRLDRIEKELETVRGCSPLTHGWQTQRYAKVSRKWDVLAQNRISILQKINDLCDGKCECCIGHINCKYP